MHAVRKLLHRFGHLFLNIDTGVRVEGNRMYCKACGAEVK